MKAHLSFIILLYSCFYHSCNVVNPVEKLPTYIQIDSVKVLATQPGKHGSIHHNITDVWVYYNNNIVGAYELPARVPILAEGKGQLQIRAGVYENGLSGTRIGYPFYTTDILNFEANATQTISHLPIFNYRTSDTPAVTYLIENFEQGNIFSKRFNSDTTIVRSNKAEDVFEDDWSGLIWLKDSIDYAESITAQPYKIPPFRNAFMELSYKSDVNFNINLEITYNGSIFNAPVISLLAANKWKKSYIKLGGFADTYQGADFKLVIQTTKPSTLNEAKLLIDNFKIIYFK